MKKQRPTIPLFEWKLAVDLEATRSIQNQEGTPAYQCDCYWCSKWKDIAKDLLPENTLNQLIRIGIDIDHPTELYEFREAEGYNSLCVVYHSVGEILSGPAPWKQDSNLGNVMMYKTVREKPFTSLLIYPQKQLSDPVPRFEGKEGELVRIDFRLDVPA